MKNLSKVLVISCLAVSALALASGGGSEIRAMLAGTGKGKASWKVDDRGSRMRAELQVEGEHLAANSDFSVTVGSNDPFTVTTNGRGEFESHQRFVGPDRPSISVGDSVTVSDEAEAVVLSGTFSNR